MLRPLLEFDGENKKKWWIDRLAAPGKWKSQTGKFSQEKKNSFKKELAIDHRYVESLNRIWHNHANNVCSNSVKFLLFFLSYTVDLLFFFFLLGCCTQTFSFVLWSLACRIQNEKKKRKKDKEIHDHSDLFSPVFFLICPYPSVRLWHLHPRKLGQTARTQVQTFRQIAFSHPFSILTVGFFFLKKKKRFSDDRKTKNKLNQKRIRILALPFSNVTCWPSDVLLPGTSDPGCLTLVYWHGNETLFSLPLFFETDPGYCSGKDVIFDTIFHSFRPQSFW